MSNYERRWILIELKFSFKHLYLNCLIGIIVIYKETYENPHPNAQDAVLPTNMWIVYRTPAVRLLQHFFPTPNANIYSTVQMSLLKPLQISAVGQGCV